MAYIEISNLYKTYSKPGDICVPVIEDFNLTIEKGEFVSFFGPNACGKTTLINTLAGLVDFDKGSITIGGKRPSETKVGFVFQDYNDSLFPWLKNVDNIAFSLISGFNSKKQKREYVRNYVKDMGLGELPLDKFPYECSGGQQQLIALIRELIYEPNVLILDEPFASLDYDRRITQQEHLAMFWEKAQPTVLFVSHELDEAIFLSDKLVLLSQRPAQVVSIYEIDLPRPRDLDIFEQEMFFRFKVPILQKFREIIGK